MIRIESGIGMIVDGSIKETLGAEWPKLIDKMTIRFQPKIGPASVFNMVKGIIVGGKQCYIFPRASYPSLCKLLSCKVSIPTHWKFEPKPISDETHGAYDYQVIIGKYVINRLYNCGVALLEQPAGTGKTFTAKYIIKEMNLRALYVVPKKPLKLQTIAELDGCADVMVINSVMKKDAAFFKQYQLIIFDEVHTYLSDCRIGVFNRSIMPYQFAMSATLDQRKDGRDLYTQKYFGSIISANTLLHEFGLSLDVGSYHLHVTIVYYRGADEFTGALSRGGQLCSQLMIENMFRDQFRINMIAGMVKQLVAEGHRVYVFSEYLEGLELVLEQLTGLEVDLDAQRFTGKCTDKEIKDATNAQVILTSYGYGSTGVSIVTMTAEIYMTPRRAGFLQTIPRIMRKGSDPLKERRVIDIVDVGCPLQHQLKCRQLAYAHFDATIDSIVVKSDSNTPSRYVPPRS